MHVKQKLQCLCWPGWTNVCAPCCTLKIPAFLLKTCVHTYGAVFARVGVHTWKPEDTSLKRVLSPEPLASVSVEFASARTFTH